MYTGEAGSIDDFIPTGGTNTVVTRTSGLWRAS